MLRRTKIIATLGPATDDNSTIEKLIRAGVNLVRINFSHGKLSDQQRRIKVVRDCAAALGSEVGILADLQGPKIRIAQFVGGRVDLKPDASFVLDASLPESAGTQEAVGIDYKELAEDVKAGDILFPDKLGVFKPMAQ